jgi:hypothetical protein
VNLQFAAKSNGANTCSNNSVRSCCWGGIRGSSERKKNGKMECGVMQACGSYYFSA